MGMCSHIRIARCVWSNLDASGLEIYNSLWEQLSGCVAAAQLSVQMLVPMNLIHRNTFQALIKLQSKKRKMPL